MRNLSLSEIASHLSVKFQFDYHIYLNLLLHFLLAMLLFTLTRLGFFLVNYQYYPDVDTAGFLSILRGGLTFDLTAVLYINSLFIFLNVIPLKIRHNQSYQKILRYLFFVTNGLALAINCADIIYFQFTLKRTTASVFEAFAGESQMGGLFLRFILDYWYVTVFWVCLLFLMVWLYRMVDSHSTRIYKRPMYYITSSVVMLLAAYLTVVGIRGGFTKATRPINMNNAGKYVNKPIEMAAVLNTPFCLIRTIDKKAPERFEFFESDSRLSSVYSPNHPGVNTDQFRKENVMIIILESFSREYVGSLNPDEKQTYTPFLDSLVSRGLAFDNAYANGMKSIDGLPAVVSSIPALVHPFVLSHGSTNNINSIASLLKDKGYNASYFYGGPNGSMGYDAFVNLAGFDHYVGKNEYGNNQDFDGVWGIWDEEFFTFTADWMREVEEPFCNVLMSVTSHHPFKVPDKHKKRFESDDPYERVIPYTDYALRRFFNLVSSMDWYENTLFVITADHSSGHYAPRFKTTVGLFAVPIVFFKPGSNLTGLSHRVAQQIDIMPTILSYLNYDQPYVAFGNDLFNNTEEQFAINYVSGSYQIIGQEYALQFDGRRTYGVYNYRSDPLLSHNVMNQEPEIREMLELQLKARIQQYNTRLLENRMIVPQLELYSQ